MKPLLSALIYTIGLLVAIAIASFITVKFHPGRSEIDVKYYELPQEAEKTVLSTKSWSYNNWSSDTK